ncbi:ATP-binding protein [Streptomyces sp. NPDC020667]|uniref:ATP-binding protein n=1 Tax=Streptomyces sp. NPDC020667 TaxID=3154895 RepID=UPI00340B45DB
MATVANPQPWTYTLELSRDPRAPGIARATLKSVLHGHGMPELADTAQLLASELVTNAYVHTEGPSSMRVDGEEGDHLRVSVWDTCPRVPALFGGIASGACGGPESASGRGLWFARLWASAWGSDRGHAGGKVLWFELSPEGRRVRESASPVGCGECAGLEAVRRKVVASGAAQRAVEEATIAVRRHFRDAHLLNGSTW